MKNFSEIIEDEDIVTKKYLEENAGGGDAPTLAEFRKLQKLQAYDMAVHDINNHIAQPYSGMFYNLFYSTKPVNSLGMIDNDYILPSVNPSSGKNYIAIDASASSMGALFGAIEYEFTIQDNNNKEIILGKTNGELAPKQLTFSNLPFTYTFNANAILYLEINGGAGEDRVGPGGNGGKIEGTMNISSGDELSIESVAGGLAGTSGKQSSANGGCGGNGISVKINSTLVAVVAGGGGCGGVRYKSGNEGTPAPGGNGGGTIGDAGNSREGGGGTGGTQSKGGIGGTEYGADAEAGTNGSKYSGGKGGSAGYGDSSCGGGGGGSGYYGGAGGGGAFRDNTSSVNYEAGGGGGGSSYVGGLSTTKTNSKGTNDNTESCLIFSYTGEELRLILDEPLIKSYVSPIVYRSWVIIDTENNKVNPKQINDTDINKFDVRYIIKSLQEFDEIATWLTFNKNLSITRLVISFANSQPQNEVVENLSHTNFDISNTLLEARTEITKDNKYKYATIGISFSMSNSVGSNDINSILGVVS